MVLYNIEEVFSIFDSIKPRLNEILIKGIESTSRENYTEISKLKEQLEYMNLNSLNQQLDFFLDNIDQILQNNVSIELRKKITINAFQIITIIRMYERIMTHQLVMNELKKKK
jgi:hypothetical protein